jgi:glycosyltransferase involved in cell wall biosynthesis
LKWAEKLATLRSECLIADSPVIKDYMEKTYTKPVAYIAYGADIPGKTDPVVVKGFGLTPGAYDLIVARFIHDNNIEMAIMAKLLADDDVPLVIIGNLNAYRTKLVEEYGSSNKVIFMEPVYEKASINSLRSHCRLYVHGHSSGGTNPSLLEGMACGSAIAAHDNQYNRVVTGDDAYYFSTKEELAHIFDSFNKQLTDAWVLHNLEKIRNQYNWEKIVDQYEELFYEVVANK